MANDKIIITGGAGLVGQNLIMRLKARGYVNIVALDKHKTNLAILRQMQPDITAEYADIAVLGDRQQQDRAIWILI